MDQVIDISYYILKSVLGFVHPESSYHQMPFVQQTDADTTGLDTLEIWEQIAYITNFNFIMLNMATNTNKVRTILFVPDVTYWMYCTVLKVYLRWYLFIQSYTE